VTFEVAGFHSRRMLPAVGMRSSRHLLTRTQARRQKHKKLQGIT